MTDAPRPEPGRDAMLDLSGHDQPTLARWWCDLNTFDWPDDFPVEPPTGWAAMKNRVRKRDPALRAAFRAVNAVLTDFQLATDEWRRRCSSGATP